jgi:hypothetical protein
MFQGSKFNRVIVAGIAAAAIAPAAAVAQPADNGGGAPGTGAAPAVVQDFRTPDQVDGSKVGNSNPGPPQWPANPKQIHGHHIATGTSTSVDGDGVDTGVLIALGGGALLVAGGIGIAGRKRLQVVRQRQLA